MPLLSFPNEFLIIVARNLHAKNLNSFCRTNRHLYIHLTFILYDSPSKNRILRWAAERGLESPLRRALANGASLSSRPDETVLVLLLDRGANIAAVFNGYRALHSASASGHETVVGHLFGPGC